MYYGYHCWLFYLTSLIVLFKTYFSDSLTQQDLDELSKIDIRVYREVKNSEHFDSMEDFQEWVYKTDTTFLTYYYSKNHPFSKMGAYYLYKLENRLDYLAKIVFIDCDEIKNPTMVKDCNVKDRNGERLLPRIKGAIPSKNKYNPITKKIDIHTEVNYSESAVSSELMFKFIINNTISHTHFVTVSNITDFLNTPLLNKIIIFHEESLLTTKEVNKLEKVKERERLIKGLSNIYYDRILIGEVYNNTLAKEYGISEFPKMVAFENNFFRYEKANMTIIKHQVTLESMLKTFEKYSLNEKLYMRLLYDQSLEDVKIFPLTASTYSVYMRKFDKNNRMVFFTYGDNMFLDNQESEINALNGFYVYAKINCRAFEIVCSTYFNITITPQEKKTLEATSTSLFAVKNYPSSKHNVNDVYTSKQNSKVIARLNDSVYENFLASVKDKIVSYTGEIVESKLSQFKVNSDNKGDNGSILEIIHYKDLSKKIFEARNSELFNFIYIHDLTEQVHQSIYKHIVAKAISSNEDYHEKVKFIEVDNPTEKLLKLLKIKTLPAAMIVYHNKIDDEGFKVHNINNITYIEAKKALEKVNFYYSMSQITTSKSH